MKIVGFVFGVFTLLLLDFIAFFPRTAISLAGTDPTAHHLLIIALSVVVSVMWAITILATRPTAPTSFYPKGGVLVYALWIIFGVLSSWSTNVFVFDRIFDERVMVEGLIVGVFFFGVPMATAMLCVLYPFRKKSS